MTGRIDHTEDFGPCLTDTRLGLISWLAERRTLCPISIVREYASRIRSPLFPMAQRQENGGRGHLPGEAYQCAVGEAVERYALSICDPDTLVKATVGALKTDAWPVENFTFFLDAQYDEPGFPFQKPTDKDTLQWVEGYDVTTDRPVFIPASLVYVPYRRHTDEPALSYQMSPGTGCHTSWAKAATNAILELIERDAFTILWEAGAAFPKADPSPALRDMLAFLPDYIEHGVYDITTDVGVPTALVTLSWRHMDTVAENAGRSAMNTMGLTYGIACKKTPGDAQASAFREAITSWISAVVVAQAERMPKDALYRHIVEHPDYRWHMLWSALGYASEDMAFLDQATAQSAAPPDTMRPLGDLLRRSGMQVVLVDITPPDIADLGLFVARAVSCSLVRPSLGRHGRHLRNGRFVSVPRKLSLPHLYQTRESIHEHYRPEP